MDTAHRTRLSLDEAVAAILAHATPLPAESVALEQTLERALAEPVVSPIDLPLWDNSGMDGYAVRRSDVLGASVINPVVLPVTTTILAGSDERPEIAEGTCARIMTGAPLPPGADAVVRVEDTDRGIRSVRITDDRDVRAVAGNVRARGEDVRRGDVVFDRGTSIGPIHVGVLSSVGAAQVLVHRRPRVALLSTGDELVRVEAFDQTLAGRRIVASTNYSLPAWIASLGANVAEYPLVADTLEGVMAAITRALDDGCDLLMTTGGVSVGAHDYTRDALQQLGGDIAFWRARIRPGGPIGVGTVRGTPWLGLPGNPVSTMVTAELFARPLLRRMAGHAQVLRTPIRVRAGDSFKGGGELTHLLRGIVSRGADGAPEARNAGTQSSNLLRTMALANALLIVPDDVATVNEGEMLDALMLGEIE
ncbi:MAG: gephyrin-like molybdotransferase Glp [Gemmatimonas sp.]